MGFEIAGFLLLALFVAATVGLCELCERIAGALETRRFR